MNMLNRIKGVKDKADKLVIAAMTMMSVAATPVTNVLANSKTTDKSALDVSGAQNAIVGMINSLLTPILTLVGAVGALYCVLLGVKYAKAEEPQDREKAKAHLKNAIIGFVLIFVLIVALRLLLPSFTKWMNANAPA